MIFSAEEARSFGHFVVTIGLPLGIVAKYVVAPLARSVWDGHKESAKTEAARQNELFWLGAAKTEGHIDALDAALIESRIKAAKDKDMVLANAKNGMAFATSAQVHRARIKDVDESEEVPSADVSLERAKRATKDAGWKAFHKKEISSEGFSALLEALDKCQSEKEVKVVADYLMN